MHAPAYPVSSSPVVSTQFSGGLEAADRLVSFTAVACAQHIALDVAPVDWFPISVMPTMPGVAPYASSVVVVTPFVPAAAVAEAGVPEV